MSNRAFFINCYTAEDLKKEYKIQAKLLHPDCGGNKDMFQWMQAEFEEAWKRLKNIHVNADGKKYEKATAETAGEYMSLINTLIHMVGVQTEICGSWIWCSGNTKAYKDVFKELQFRFSRNKAAWYYHREPYRRWGNNKVYSLDDIRKLYGSEKYEHEEQLKLA